MALSMWQLRCVTTWLTRMAAASSASLMNCEVSTVCTFSGEGGSALPAEEVRPFLSSIHYARWIGRARKTWGIPVSAGQQYP